ncbi:MAG: hypothetical protein UY44_C0014G0023 [Candidatus Kaiserbacteria bacterium GW2011_GWA2_49_19]|uniref:Uncharacterized protein n=1 Tax=Candidatus Kaiserbacteria bacterium GW2011_GWA2_49_19 TaxID=1618669 RepID=A0A0G1VP50_9BACT|nr:MAG: hypothetical protein UY44_C0014G0023 [Candidatus Kaiserbacteria bacterium GW2011_GWA2_49_19]
MALKNLLVKSFLMVNGRKLISAAALLAAVGLLSASIGLGGVLNIDNKTVTNFKFFLGTLKTFANVAITDDQIRGLFNLTVGGASTGADVSYGLLVLSAMNEFDLIDMVSSQVYKEKARDYFDSVIDSRLDMVDRGGDIGFDMITVFFKLIKQGGASATPLTTLSLNSFAITGKTIAIFNTLNVLRQEKLYDGIWRYFDSRRGGENHQIAWEDAKAEMGFAVGPELIKAKFLSGSGVSQDTKADVLGKISLQFAALWNTWGQKTDAFGIKPEFKEKFAGEISSIISTGLNSSQLTQSQPKSFLDKAAVEIARLKNLLASLVDQINFKAAAF